MCGIVGVLGDHEVAPIIVEGLKRRDLGAVRAAIQAHLEHLALNVRNRFEKEAAEAAR